MAEVKLLESTSLSSLEDTISQFLESYHDEDIVNVSISTSNIENSTTYIAAVVMRGSNRRRYET